MALCKSEELHLQYSKFQIVWHLLKREQNSKERSIVEVISRKQLKRKSHDPIKVMVPLSEHIYTPIIARLYVITAKEWRYSFTRGWAAYSAQHKKGETWARLFLAEFLLTSNHTSMLPLLLQEHYRRVTQFCSFNCKPIKVLYPVSSSSFRTTLAHDGWTYAISRPSSRFPVNFS